MRCCQNKTSFSWYYRDSSKRSLENNVISRRGGGEKYTHFKIGRHVQMAKIDPKAQRKSSLSDCTWLERWVGSFNPETLKFLMHFKEPGSSLYFIFTYSYFFLFSFFISLYSLFSFFLYLCFYLLPLNSKIALYLPSPPCLDICLSSSKEVIEIR
jgi:hypothetical protein